MQVKGNRVSLKKIAMLLLKICVTALAFYLVFRKVSWKELTETLGMMNWAWLVLAFFLYNLSQVISSYRLLGFYRQIGVAIPFPENLAIYYKAMFYGLFLPGGVSGDAYKVIRIQKNYNRNYREMIIATLSDRLNGLTVMLSLVLFLTWLARGPLLPYLRGWHVLILPAILVGWAFYYFLTRKFAAPHHMIIAKTTLLSVIVQSIQLVAFFCILTGLNVPASEWRNYGLLFYVGGIAAAVPVSISGMGLREWVMVTGSGLFGLNPAIGFASAFVFFLISSLSALSGSLVPLSKQATTGVANESLSGPA